MNGGEPQLIFTTGGFTARAGLHTRAQEKAARILRHLHPRIGFVRVHVKREAPATGAPVFIACATTEKTGTDHVAHADAPTAAEALNAVFDKLERVIISAAGIRRHRRRARSIH